MKIIILDGKTVIGNDLNWQEFNGLGQLVYYERTPSDKIVERIGDADIVFTNKALINRAIIDACPNLKYIGIFATGFNVVDIDYARKKGIDVTNVPAYSTDSVAQMTFAMILEIVCNVKLHSQAVHSGEWQSCSDFCFWKIPLIELTGKTLGIVGYGSIGQQVSNIARSFKMNVIYTGRRKIAGDVSLDYLLKNSDFVSLHCPLTSKNAEMINSKSLKLMKPNAWLINTARGGLINENDLTNALNNNVIAGAALDVVSSEPVKPTNPLLGAKNCIITPHIAWAPKETRKRLIYIAVENLKKWQEGKPKNLVN